VGSSHPIAAAASSARQLYRKGTTFIYFDYLLLLLFYYYETRMIVNTLYLMSLLFVNPVTAVQTLLLLPIEKYIIVYFINLIMCHCNMLLSHR